MSTKPNWKKLVEKMSEAIIDRHRCKPNGSWCPICDAIHDLGKAVKQHTRRQLMTFDPRVDPLPPIPSAGGGDGNKQLAHLDEIMNQRKMWLNYHFSASELSDVTPTVFGSSGVFSDAIAVFRRSQSGLQTALDAHQVEAYIVQLQQTMNEVLQRVAKLEGDKHE